MGGSKIISLYGSRLTGAERRGPLDGHYAKRLVAAYRRFGEARHLGRSPFSVPWYGTVALTLIPYARQASAVPLPYPFQKWVGTW